MREMNSMKHRTQRPDVNEKFNYSAYSTRRKLITCVNCRQCRNSSVTRLMGSHIAVRRTGRSSAIRYAKDKGMKNAVSRALFGMRHACHSCTISWRPLDLLYNDLRWPADGQISSCFSFKESFVPIR